MNAQQKAALDTHVHCAVLANAGAGKTQVLVQRLLRILVVENVEIDAVVAITFTRAAAMEMRQRLHHLIDGILAGTEEPAPYLGGMPRAVFEPRLRRVLMQIGSAHQHIPQFLCVAGAAVCRCGWSLCRCARCR